MRGEKHKIKKGSCLGFCIMTRGSKLVEKKISKRVKHICCFIKQYDDHDNI